MLVRYTTGPCLRPSWRSALNDYTKKTCAVQKTAGRRPAPGRWPAPGTRLFPSKNGLGLLPAPDSEHLGVADGTGTLRRRAAVLHLYLGGILHVSLGPALHTIRLHSTLPSSLAASSL